MKIGVVKTSCKENEKRLPLYPPHLKYIDESLRPSIVLEKDYGHDYKISDSDIQGMGYSIAKKDELLNGPEIVLLPKPTEDDLRSIGEGKILWGWTHCVQNTAIAQFAIDKKLTYISWENMHVWKDDHKQLHVFYRNNELAGYCAIVHALQLMGIDGLYGDRQNIVILGYGSVSRGAIRALHGRGFNNIVVISSRSPLLIGDRDPDVYYKQYIKYNNQIYVYDIDSHKDLNEYLFSADIIVNGVLQDVRHPLMFIRDTDLSNLKLGSLIVDISCDRGMGFEFARPTTFEEPIIPLGDIYYYSVDHTPSYLWKAASREISLALMPFLPKMVEGIDAIRRHEILSRAIDIDCGRIVNKDVIAFQKRSTDYPYNVLESH